MILESLETELKQKVKGPVEFDSAAKALYATDSSNYRHVPIAVVRPKSIEDITAVLKACHDRDVPILMRGGGTSLAGQTCNEAVVMDTSMHYNQLLELNPTEKFARVQPGIVLDDVRNAAEKYGLTFGPDPATHNRCTLGGMIGNNSCGVHSVMAGKTVDNILELDIITYDGLRMTVGPTTDEEYEKIVQTGGRRAEIYRGLRGLRDKYAELVRARYPKIPRRVSGYNLDQLLPENGFNVARALVGTEGTCMTILEAKLRLVPSPSHRALVVLAFIDIYSAGAAVPSVLEHKPIGLEGMDDMLVRNLKIKKNIHPESVHALPEGEAWLLVEFGSESDAENVVKAEKLKSSAHKMKGFRDLKIIISPEEQKNLWLVRESGLGATAFVPGQRDTWEGWEDSAVPPVKVADYLRDLKALYDKYDYQGVLYGHFGDGCIHTRITFDLVTADGIKKYHRFMQDAADLVVSYGGSISGEHGDGQSKAELLPKMFGPELIKAFEDFKILWDPRQKMNPGKIVFPESNVDHLRLGTAYKPPQTETYFQYPDDGGDFARATLRCVGVGLCRREEAGVMCPSYKVTREEKHATRGRARLLFEMLRGEVLKDGWGSHEVKEALDLCLACKGCKGECPTNVDMATYKAEFLAHYFQRKFRPRIAFSMGQIHRMTLVAKWFPRIINFFTQTPGLSFVAKKIAGIHSKRSLPKFASKPYRSDLEENKTATGTSKDVVLWVDTFCNSFHPEIAKAAHRVLSKAGFNVIVPEKQYCCGRPLYDFGFLKQAKSYLKMIMSDLAEPIRNGVPFVFLEPSCASVFRDELRNLFPHEMAALRLGKQCFMLSEFLIQKAPEFKWPQISSKALVQGHCHHQSVLKFGDEKKALMNLGLDFEILDTGCCGMAGAFGFAAETYDVSKAIADRGLIGKINASDPETLILADGFSCREQIRQMTGRRVFHLAELLDPEFKLKGIQWKN